MSSNDEMTSLNISELKGENYSGTYEDRCPKCGTTDFREIRLGEEEGPNLWVNYCADEYNICNQCNTRFSIFGEPLNYDPKLRSILIIFGIMGAVLAVVIIVSFILKLFG